jgi:hypothetical protein
MSIRLSLLIFAVLLSLAGCNSSPSNTAVGACSKLTETSEGLLIQNEYFRYLDDGSVVSIIQNELIGDSLSQTSTRMYPVYPKEDSAKWDIQFNGQDFKIFKDLLISEASENGKDASYKVFNLSNGKEVIFYTYDKFDILFSDENEKRFLGFYGMNATDRIASDLKFDKLTFGYLNYANKEGSLGQIRIATKDPLWLNVLDISNPVIELMPLKENALSLNSGKTLYFTSTDGKQKEAVNFDIQITFYTTDTYKPTSFTLQVRNDKFELSKDFSNTVFKLESL